MVTKAQISSLTKEIVEAINPEKILLFGSYANGTATEESDVDILVIVDELKDKRYKVISHIYNKIWNKFDFEKDIKIYTKSEVEDWKNVRRAFVTKAFNEGILIYERG
jgi:predicted nucleotidyltransferase